MTDSAHDSIAQRFEAFILVGDVSRMDPDGLLHSVREPVGTFESVDDAKQAAYRSGAGNPRAIGCGVRRIGVAARRAVPRTSAPTRYQAYRVPSDYMAPTFNPDDVVEIDTSVRLLPANQPDGVYLLQMPFGEPALRRLQVNLTNGRVRVFCDRDAGTEATKEEFDADDLRILGRARRVASISKL